MSVVLGRGDWRAIEQRRPIAPSQARGAYQSGSRVRQRIVLFIATYTEREGFPPTLREIATAVDLWHSTVQHHLGVLAKDGWITRTPYIARSIRLLKKLVLTADECIAAADRARRKREKVAHE